MNLILKRVPQVPDAEHWFDI